MESIQDLEKEEALSRLRKIYGSSKNVTSTRELGKAGEKAFEELEKELTSLKPISLFIPLFS